MNDRVVEERRDAGLLLSTDRSRLDPARILEMLHGSHWGASMTRELLERAVENSLCVGVYDDGRQVGFARAVTDLATYAYLTDVIIDESARGRGLGSWMVGTIVAHPDLRGLRRFALWTRDAPQLYARFGFTTDLPASNYMELRPGR